ncbi:hypothetical protein [Edaphobacter dinghuensis]|uniref:Muconolactone delta-isomerase n=1 Tax=Edaphobacter dinghuensis TaxID=1560005 RepID=A0A917H4B7_9BACT|nr:hypothetical protein [Edaphobacter dinghuensis]GGG67055.1 hypothetical protein GCM10011585_06170 [Edaphobacter dinghuensis]
MKVMAIGTVGAPLTPEQRQQVMPREVPHTLKLYLDGKIEQFWFRPDTGPVFLMDVDSVEEARAIVDDMPLVIDGLAKYQFWPVGPLAPLGLLIQGK